MQNTQEESKTTYEYLKLLDKDSRHIWHPFTQAKTAGKPLLINRAEGEFLYVVDENGEEKKLIDGISSWWVNIHGHNNPYINEAIKEQLKSFEHAIFAGFTHETAIELIGELIPILPKLDIASKYIRKLDKAFFSDNGSTSVEVAIKMAIQYWYNQGQTRRSRVIAFKDSYHGDTVGAMSASGASIFNEAFKKITVPIEFVDSPASPASEKKGLYTETLNRLIEDRAQGNKVSDTIKDIQGGLQGKEIPKGRLTASEEDSLAQIEKLCQTYKNEVAAVLIEPMVQAAGGMRFHSERFLQELRKLCDEQKIILIADEVFTGFGRTGKTFACEKAMIIPDIICLSKGLTGGYLPMGLSICTQEIYEVFHSNDRLKTFFHGHSFTGNPLSCAAALASIRLFKKENRLNDVEYINKQMKRELLVPELKGNEAVKDIRIIGALGVIELNDSQNPNYLSDLGPKLSKEFMRRHILLRPLGNVLYFLPPYTISVKSLDYCLSEIKSVVSELNS